MCCTFLNFILEQRSPNPGPRTGTSPWALDVSASRHVLVMNQEELNCLLLEFFCHNSGLNWTLLKIKATNSSQQRHTWKKVHLQFLLDPI